MGQFFSKIFETGVRKIITDPAGGGKKAGPGGCGRGQFSVRRFFRYRKV